MTGDGSNPGRSVEISRRHGYLIRRIRFSSPAILAYAFLAGLPLLLLLTFTISSTLADGRDWLSVILPGGRRLALLLQTLAFALCVAAAGTAIGFIGAGALHFTQSGRLRRLAAVMIPSAAIPSHIHAMAWNALLLMVNGLLRNAGLPRIPDQGFFISGWVQMMALLPFSLGILLLGMRGMPAELLEAARVSADDRRTVLRILLPLSAPGLAASFAFLFLVSLLDYSVPSLFQVNLYSLGIFSEYSIRYDAAHAFLMSVPMLLISLPAAWALQRSLRRLPLTPAGRDEANRWSIRLPPWMRMLSGLSVVLFLLQLLVPLFVLTAQTWPAFSSLEWLTDAIPDLANTGLICLGTAVLTLPFAHSAAMAIDGKRAGHHIWWVLTMLPLAMPSPLIGIGLIQVWNGDALGWTELYGTLFMPILACTLRFLPFSVLLLLSSMKRMDRSLFDAALILQKNRRQTLFRVHLPLLSGAYAGAGLLAAVLTAGELGATLLLVPPGAGTLTLKIYNYLHYGQSEVVSCLCLLLYLIALSIGFILQRVSAPKLRRPA
jgi:iron(III) transport system permease protein